MSNYGTLIKQTIIAVLIGSVQLEVPFDSEACTRPVEGNQIIEANHPGISNLLAEGSAPNLLS